MDANSIVGCQRVPKRRQPHSAQALPYHRQSAPERGVVLCAVNAHTRNFLGDRILAWNLLTPREQVERLLDTINADLRQEKMLLSHYQPLQKNLLASKDSEEYNNANQTLVALRDLMDSTTGKNFTVKEPLVDLARREVNKLKAEQLRLSRRDDLDASQIESKRNRLETARHDYVQVLTLFNKVGIRTELKDLNDLQVKILKNYVDEIVSTRMNWSRLNQTVAWIPLSGTTPSGQHWSKRQVKFAVALELTFQNGHIGFSAMTSCAPTDGDTSLASIRRSGGQTQGKGVIPENIKFVDALTKQGEPGGRTFLPQAIRNRRHLPGGRATRRLR